ncbi:diaminopimelate decarboxylase [Macrococcus armenti]|uniref:diaminopimelate decarboxylase n=1 Tax=Macrococcus armenti TaxID=2875764 RepID=UPI001CCF3ED9|nr:diaminopimelate decarboxylase [Macrococcus armenti]UBH14336.1 diaminopimelate decarboxylase [Macrococcus armenti]UBH16696.1 diaminopimelate decarboxylase [Macrococcus armenti]UBH18959.1 diaminopimelate decarboxylase [Macrococcus armenti]
MTLKYINNQLSINGHDVKTIAEQYGTPLFIYDENMIREQCRRFHNALQHSGLKYSISYASKALTSIQLFNIMQEENMGLDVVSEGELYAALQSKIDASTIHFHGNNKTDREIEFAILSGVEYFVIDSIEEISRINTIASTLNTVVNAILRINPGVEAHTHEFIQTGQEDSKFGLSIKHGLAIQGIHALQNAPFINFRGVHFHIGSQIFESTGTIRTIELVIEWLVNENISIDILNIGGGFSIRYTEDDLQYPIEDGIRNITETLKSECRKFNYALPVISLEPGRSIVGEAGITVYEVGTVKEIPHTNCYISIDGGMSDHIRTALYNAKYELLLVNRNEKSDKTVTIAGKLCESGDIIARNTKLPSSVSRGDLLVVKSTGAYHYSMSSNYNQMLKPSVVFVSDENIREVIKRQTLEHLFANEVI